jgi:hypothetical protein
MLPLDPSFDERRSIRSAATATKKDHHEGRRK